MGRKQKGLGQSIHPVCTSGRVALVSCIFPSSDGYEAWPCEQECGGGQFNDHLHMHCEVLLCSCIRRGPPRLSSQFLAWSCHIPFSVPWGHWWCEWRGHKVPSASLVAFQFSVPGESRPWVRTTCMTWPPSWRGSSLHYPGIFPGPEHWQILVVNCGGSKWWHGVSFN